MGVPYEFTPKSIPLGRIEWGHVGTWNQPPGTWSDDGGLMLALLDSLTSVGFDLEDQAKRAVAWMDGLDYKPGKRFDIGGTTSRALHNYKAGIPAAQCGGRQELDNGNGGLMRILPVALVARDEPTEKVVRWALRASSLTHGHPRSEAVCALYCVAVRDLLQGRKSLADVLRTAFQAVDDYGRPLRSELALITRFDKPSGSGYVVDTFVSAWEALESSRSYEEAVKRAISYGGDTDTTAAVVGGLAGAYYGVAGIPGDWLADMRGKQIVEPMIARLTASTVVDMAKR